MDLRSVNINNPRVRAMLGSLTLALIVVFLLLAVSIIKNEKREVVTFPDESVPEQEKTSTSISEEEVKKILNQKAETPIPISDEEVKRILNQKAETPIPISDEEAKRILNTGAHDYQESR